MMDNGVLRTKYYREYAFNGQANKEGKYVAPDYAKNLLEYNTISYRLNNFFGECNVNDTTLFLEDLNANFIANENYEKKPDSIQCKKEKDGSVSLFIKIENDYVNRKMQSLEGYQKSSYQDEITFYVKDGKITSYDATYIASHFYEDASKNELEINENSIEFSYEFDQKTYDNFDITTDTTENDYYGNVTFIVEGQNFLFSDSILVGEKYTNAMAKEYLANLDNFLISSSKETSQYIALYTDKEMTVPFEKMTMEENVTLYVQLVVPEDKSAVITLFKRQDGLIRIQLVYIKDAGSTFRCSYKAGG